MPPAPERPDADALAAQFALIRARFVAGLPARWQEIRQAPDAGARHAALHRLAGAAGGFGCETLGDLARAAMALSDPAHTGKPAGTPGAALAGALQALGDEIARLAGA